MTREEQIREASIDYQLSTNPRAIGGDAFADFAREMNVNPSFIAGAKWADKTMIDKACEWIEDTYPNYIWSNTLSTKISEDFKKAMKGGEE